MITRSNTIGSRNSNRLSNKSRGSQSRNSKNRGSKNRDSKSRGSQLSRSRSQTLKLRPKISSNEILSKRGHLKSRKNAKKMIARTMEKNRSNIKSHYLKALCSDSGVCLAFGKKRNKIKSFFNNFSDFSLVKQNAKRLGEPSSNGFVYEIPYEKNNYKAYSILKTSINAQSDNLVYEYFVGKHLNDLGAYFPCLVETYGLYQYKSMKAWNTAKRSKQISNLNDFLTEVKLPDNFDFNDKSVINIIKDSCNQPMFQSVLIQHFHDVESLNDYTELCNSMKGQDDDYTQLITLFHVYFFLHHNRETFTHYDLHTGNVLLYKPFSDPNKKIEYTYHIGNNKTITFQSSYIVKIIDYGRSYISGGVKKFHKTVCKQEECEPNCGKKLGYGLIDKVPPKHNDFYYITSMYPNVSHDLRLYNLTLDENRNSIIRMLKPPLYVHEFGTPPVHKNNTNKRKVCNVTDAYMEILNKMLLVEDDISSTPNENIIAKITVYGKKTPMSVLYKNTDRVVVPPYNIFTRLTKRRRD